LRHVGRALHVRIGHDRLKEIGHSPAARDLVSKIYKNVTVLDSGARGSTNTFVQRSMGDVLIAWENEAYLAEAQAGKGEFEIIYPSVSILAEPPVAMVEKNAARKGTLEAAKAYLQYLYTPQAQELAAKYYYRPSDEKIAAKYASRFPKMAMVTIADFGGWEQAQKTHFADGGSFDRIYEGK